MNQNDPVKIEIPWGLHIQIVKLQGKLESSYLEAYLEASKLIESNRPKFEKAVITEAHRLEIRNLMKKINKSRKSWKKKVMLRDLLTGKNKDTHSQKRYSR
jgi:hypothetical protein